MNWNNPIIKEIIERAIQEDIWTGDLSSELLIPESELGKAVIICNEECIIAGLPVAEMVFYHLSDEILFTALVEDGDRVEEGQVIAEIKGPVREILKGERVALNFLQRLSGIASRTNIYVNAVSQYPVKIVDTRKTTPTLRILEKYAVRVGGGYNHRMGLYDGVLLKDNHIIAAGGISRAVEIIRSRLSHTVKIEVEVEDIAGVEEALNAGVDIIMLDNMDIEEMKIAVGIINGQALVEASGGISLEGLVEIAEAGVDIISVGALTHHIKAIDMSLSLV